MKPAMMATTALVSGLALLPGLAWQGSDLDGLDLLSALPTATELRGFAHVVRPSQRIGGAVRPHYRGDSVGLYKSASCFVRREADGLLLRVTVTATTTASAMDELSRRSIETPTGDFPRGNPSGGRIAPYAWHTLRPGSRTARGTYGLVVRDGRAKASVRLMHRVEATSGGRPEQKELARDDLLLAERLAVGCLERLRKLGYGDDQWRKAQSRTRGGKKPKGK